jgi:hypothetical protein
MTTFLDVLDRFPFDPRSASVLVSVLFVLMLLVLPLLAFLARDVVRHKTRNTH